jgi:hypothetical protein
LIAEGRPPPLILRVSPWLQWGRAQLIAEGGTD